VAEAHRSRLRRSSIAVNYGESIMKQMCERIALVVVAVSVAQASIFATVVTEVPEITPGSLSAGLGLLAAGVLMLRARIRSKRGQ
jgi:hypothetical protein